MVVTGGTTEEDYDGGCHRTLAASDERGPVQACMASRTAGGRGRRGEEGQSAAKTELEEENMELPGCAGHSSSAQSLIRGGGGGLPPSGDVSGARRGHGDAVPSVRPCNI